MKGTVTLLSLLAAGAANAAVVGFVEDFPAAGGTAGFFSGATLSNPGTGGVGGAGDGYLLVTREFEGHFGAATMRTEFTGDLIADGVTGFSLWLNDVGDNEVFEVHVGVGTANQNFWLYTVPFTPPDNEWGYFYADVTNAGAWTQIMGSGTFEDALRNSNRLLIRHDLEPFVQHPDEIAGDLGIDQITVVPEPATLLALTGLVALALRRRAKR
ncbi:MAG: PEP-CTERM sorting domain-containing protein [Armatimonadetes bacterium]|nr:PEP-CTERM sorting domain-containing protein [Armatimonadota bacterium]